MSATRTYPIVLAQGFARFDALREFFVSDPRNPLSKLVNRILSAFGGGEPPDRLHYFRGIRSHLKANGFEVYHTDVSFAGGVERRAADLKRGIGRVLAGSRASKVHVIAHSMGGLDTRYAVARLGMADRVASLTTVGTPHHGSPYADHKRQHGVRERLVDWLDRVIDVDGLKSLTLADCKLLNEALRDAEASNNVFYQVYSAHQARRDVLTALQLSWKIISDAEGENDGLVSVRSQEWVEELRGSGGAVKRIERRKFPFPADHFNECGWWDVREGLGRRDEFEAAVRRLYLGIAQDLRERFPL